MSKTLACQSCGRELAEGDKFCPGCGTAVTDPADTVTGQYRTDVGTNPTECASCGYAMGQDDQFCPKCGTAGPEAETVVSHVSLRNSQAAHRIDLTRGEYEIIERLGHGAMGAVYLARDIALSRRVAIKVIAPNLLADETMVSRFRLEAQTVASLRHPNIVDVYAVRQAEDIHYFVMEFIDGPTLRSIIKQQAPLDTDVVQGILFQVGSALSYAHRAGQGVIHRDVKPANIMLDYEGDAFVTDFGISKVAEVQSGLTQTGATIGTPEYMSPEQCMGESLTGASDQYALGVVAYEMLCGRTPFAGSHYSIMMAHTQERPEPIVELRPDCPPNIAEAVQRMLAKKPDERWPNLDEAVVALGGEHLGYQHPTRAKLVTLVEGTKTEEALSADPDATPVTGSESAADTATSVTVTGLPSRIEPGDTFSLEADIRGAGEVSLTGVDVEWTTTDPSIATVEDGQVEALRSGSVSITAMVGDVASSVLLKIAEPSPASVAVKPASISMHEGGRILLGAKVLDRRDRPLEADVAWRSSDDSVVTVSDTGEVVAIGPGSATVTAESETVTGTARVVVEGVAAPTVAVPTTTEPGAEEPATPSPPRQSPPLGSKEAASRPAAASPSSATGSTPRPRPTASPGPKRRSPAAMIGAVVLLVAVGGTGYWALSRPSGVEADPSQVDGVGSDGPGSEEFGPVAADTATSGDSLLAGGPGGEPPVEPVGAEAAAADEDDPVDPTPAEPEPTVEQPEEAAPTVDEPDDTGPVTVPPTTEPEEEETPAQPDPVPVPGEVTITTSSQPMLYGETRTASERVLSTDDAPMPAGSYTPAWESTDPTVLDVEDGTVEAVGPGSASLVASVGAVSDTVPITVTVAVEIDQTDFPLEQDESRDLSARGLGFDDAEVPLSPVWSTSDPTIATVDASTGLVTAVAPGEAQIIASIAGYEDRVTVTVEAAAPDPPTAGEVREELQRFVALLDSGDRDRVTELWGAGDPDELEELLDEMGQRDYEAELASVDDFQPAGNEVVATFRVDTSWRGFAAARTNSSLLFRAELRPSNGSWILTSSYVVPEGQQ